MLDLNLRQALLVSDGSFVDFFTRPISGVTLVLAILLLISSMFPFMLRKLQIYRASVKDE